MMTTSAWLTTALLFLSPTAAVAQRSPMPPVPPVAPIAPAPVIAAPAPAPMPDPQPLPVPDVPAVDGERRAALLAELDAVRGRLASRLPLQLDDRAVRELERQAEQLAENVRRLDERSLRDLERQARMMSEEALRLNGDAVRRIEEQARLAADELAQGVRIAGAPRRTIRDDETDDAVLYNGGLTAIQQRQYDRAIALFDRALAQKTARADGALYWKSFALARLARVDEALATLATLRRDHPRTRYLADATVLEADVRKMSGQPIDPEALDASDEIKLLAINGIARTNPDRAIPLLEGVLNGTNTLGNKKRALYVLALNEDPRARQILLRYAKGAGTPELQVEAIRYLALQQNAPTRDAELREIYQSTDDAAVRRTIIDAFRMTGGKSFLVDVAKDRTVTVDLRRSAISGLAGLAAPTELWALYQQEPDPALRMQMVGVLASLGAVDQLVTAVRTEQNQEVRQRAIQVLGSQKSDRTSQALVEVYEGEVDPAVRRAVIAALGAQGQADSLIALARRETNLGLKRDIVRHLSAMAPKNKAAADYLLEVIK